MQTDTKEYVSLHILKNAPLPFCLILK